MQRSYPTVPASLSRWLSVTLGLSAVILAAFAFVKHSWALPDIYLIGRIARQAWAGNGLHFNAIDPIQTATSPLWLLLMTMTEGLNPGGVYLNALILSALCLIALLVILWWWLRSGAVLLLTVTVLLSSWTYFDWHGGGVENPLTYLTTCSLAVLFLRLPAPGTDAERNLPLAKYGIETLHYAAVPAAALILTRHEMVMLAAPVMLWLAWHGRRTYGVKGITLAALITLAPVVCWMSFAVLYYGSPTPASSGAAITVDLMDGVGSRYWHHMIVRDPLFLVGVIGGSVLAVWRGGDRERVLIGCVWVGVFFITVAAANGTAHFGRYTSWLYLVSILAGLNALLPIVNWKALAGAAVVVALCAVLWLAGINTALIPQYDHWARGKEYTGDARVRHGWKDVRFSYGSSLPHYLDWGDDCARWLDVPLDGTVQQGLQNHRCLLRHHINNAPKGEVIDLQHLPAPTVWREAYHADLDAVIFDDLWWHHDRVITLYLYQTGMLHPDDPKPKVAIEDPRTGEIRLIRHAGW